MKVRFFTVYGHICGVCFKNSIHLMCCILFFACNDNYEAKPDQSGLFIKFFGGVAADEAYAAEQTDDGGFISIGTTNSFGEGSTDMYVFKTDANGNKIWDRTFGGQYADKGKDLEIMPDGGFLFLGSYAQDNGFLDLNLIRTDNEGNVLWSQTFGLPARHEDAHSLRIAGDGSFLLIGNSIGPSGNTDMYIVKAKADGSKLWERNYGLSGLKDDIGTVQVTKSGNLIWCGSEYRKRSGYTSGTSDMRVILTQPEGYLLWDRNYGKENTETGIDIQVLSNGFIVAGTIFNTQTGNTDVYVVRLFEDGTEWWSQTYGDIHNEEGKSISLTRDGGFIITGSIGSEREGGKDIYLLKVDERGKQQWVKTFGGRLDDTATVVRQTKDGGYMVGGTVTFENNTMMCLIKTNHKGELVNR